MDLIKSRVKCIFIPQMCVFLYISKLYNVWFWFFKILKYNNLVNHFLFGGLCNEKPLVNNGKNMHNLAWSYRMPKE